MIANIARDLPSDSGRLAGNKNLRRKLFTAAAAILIVANFLYLASEGLFSYVNPDDSMNLYAAWLRSGPDLVLSCLSFWAGSVRPLGQLFYRLLYEVFGWNPLPFRIACFALLLVNIGLCWRLAYALTRSLQTTILATAIVSFNGSLWSIYASSGTVYDVLCQCFFLLGLVSYIRRRGSGSGPSLLAAIELFACTVASFQSKEMGLMLPAVVLASELLFNQNDTWRAHRSWVLRVIAPAGMASAAGLLGWRYAQNGVHFSHVAYIPVFGWAPAIASAQAHLSLLLFRSVTPSEWQTVAVVIAALGLALLMRSRLMLFGWVYYHVAMLPLTFTTPRHDGYVLYIPIVGVALYLAALVEGIASRWPQRPLIRTVSWAVALLTVVLLQWVERPLVHQRDFGPGGESAVRELSEYAKAHTTQWLPSQGIVVINDPLGDKFQPQFVFSLATGRRDLRISEVRGGSSNGLAAPGVFVALYRNGHFEDTHQAPD
ncbi:MAG: hypothetical protein ABI693_01655 [Bryobacteraceae bacterium]